MLSDCRIDVEGGSVGVCPELHPLSKASGWKQERYEKVRANLDRLFGWAYDYSRWLIALFSDARMRLEEAIGLLKQAIVLEGDIPYIDLSRYCL